MQVLSNLIIFRILNRRKRLQLQFRSLINAFRKTDILRHHTDLLRQC